MKIIFLDIDGVVSNARIGYFNLDIYVVNFLRWLCQVAEAKIVIISTWRYSHKQDFWESIFGEYMHEDWATPITKMSGNRGHDIRRWLEDHPEVTTYIILDDDRDFNKDQLPHLIQTNSVDGMLAKDMIQARDAFGIKTFMNQATELYQHPNMFAPVSFGWSEKDKTHKHKPKFI